MDKGEPVFFTDAEQMSKWVDADYQLMTREIEGVEKIIYGVVRQKAIAQGILPTKKIPKGLKEWEVATEVETEAPKFDDNFNKEDLDEVRKTESTFYPVFMHKDFALNQTDIDAGNNKWYNKNLLELTVSGLTGTIADYKEKVIWRGYDISGRAHAAANRQGTIDTNSKGIMGTTNVQAMSAGAGGDSDITAAGDGPASVAEGAGPLVDYDYYGPYDFLISPGCYKQLIANLNSTTHITDIERMHSMIDIKGNKILRNMDITKYLLGTAETTSTGAMLCFDRKTPAGEPTAYIAEEYPIAYLPMSRTRFGAAGKIIWAGIPVVIRPYAFSKDEAITT